MANPLFLQNKASSLAGLKDFIDATCNRLTVTRTQQFAADNFRDQ